MALKAAVHIETALRNERTVLKNSFCQPPFRIADVTEDKRQKELRLMLMSSSPGVLDGDEYNWVIRLGEGSSLSLETQSYQRIFQMQNGATQTMQVEMQQGSSFVYLPHPSVPHKSSVFTAKNKIYLNEACSLLWGEVISCGRKLNDEVFAFTSYRSLTEIFLNDKLVVKENLCLEPAEMNLRGIGHLEAFTHQATLLYLNEAVNAKELADVLAEEQAPSSNFVFGITALPVNGLAVRFLGRKAEELFAVLTRIACRAQSFQSNAVPKMHAHV